MANAGYLAAQQRPDPGETSQAAPYLAQLVEVRQSWQKPDTHHIGKLIPLLKSFLLPRDTHARYLRLLHKLTPRTPSPEDDQTAYILQGMDWVRNMQLDSATTRVAKLLNQRLSADERAQTLLLSAQIGSLRGKYRSALQDVLQAQRLLKNSRDTVLMATTYLQFGVIYGQEGHHDEVAQAYKTGANLLKNSDARYLHARILNNLANLYYDKPDSALYYLRQGYSVSKRATLSRTASLGIVATSLTEVFILVRQLDSARYYSREATAYLEQGNNFEYWVGLQQSLAQLAVEERQYPKAIEHLSLVIDKARPLQMRGALRDCYLKLANIYVKQNRWRQAYELFDRQNSLTDSLMGLDQVAELARLTESHNAAMRQASIGQLKEEQQSQQATLKEQSLWLVVVVVVMLCLGTMLVFGVVTYRRLQLEQSRLRNLRHMEEDQHTQLQATGRTKDQLLQIIANELRDPISRWQELPDVLEPLVPQLDYHAMHAPLDRFRQHTEEVSIILESLLGWARAQQNILDYAPQAVSLLEICESLKPLATLYNTTPVTVVDAPPQLRLWADLATLQTTLRNLVAQAIQHLPPGGALHMGARAHDNTVEVFFFGKENKPADAPSASLLSQALISDLVHHNRGTLHHDHAYLHGGYLFSLELPRATDARVLLEMAG